MRVTADLTFSVDLPNSAGRPSRCVGQVVADGTEISVVFDPMPSLIVPAARPLARPLAAQLEQLGMSVQLIGPSGPLVRLGAGVRASWWQRIATRGAPIQLVSVRALIRSLTGPRVFDVVLPSGSALQLAINAPRSGADRVRGLARQVRSRRNTRPFSIE